MVIGTKKNLQNQNNCIIFAKENNKSKYYGTNDRHNGNRTDTETLEDGKVGDGSSIYDLRRNRPRIEVVALLLQEQGQEGTNGTDTKSRGLL